MRVVQPIEWTAAGVVMIDQRRLPAELVRHTYTDYREVAAAIREMVIRGAPAIGVAAAMGIALGVLRSKAQSLAELQSELDAAQQRLAQSRQEAATAEREFSQLQHRLGEVRQDLTIELNRLDEARRSADSAERHAKETRARVQREAKRVADLAAAAVMAAAAGGTDTGEFPKVVIADEPPAGPVAEPSAGPTAGRPAGPIAGPPVPETRTPADNGVAAQGGPVTPRA